MNAEGVDQTRIVEILKQLAKNYVFQMEKGHETGHLHYQGRLSLIKKARKHEVMKLWEANTEVPFPNYFEPTVNAPKVFDYNCYASKADSRIGEVITDKVEEAPYIPRQYRDKLNKLYPFQQVIFDTARDFDDRTINMIYCESGNKGKSTIASI